MSIFDGNLLLSATVASGVEAILKREMKDMGFDPSPAINGRICFAGNYRDMVRANMFLRTANHIFINLAEFKAENFDELFDNIYNIGWENIIPQNARILVDAKSNKSKLFALSAIQKIGKKAIVERLKSKLNLVTLPETEDEYHIEISLNSDMALVALDTSGNGLHKRGYRPTVGLAPIKETLAAAMVLLSVWNKDRPLIDCFCGSGTIPIEAALIGANIATGINRNFAFEHFKNAPNCLDSVKEEAKDNENKSVNMRISGFDIDKNSIKMAAKHAELAGVSDYIHFQCMDMRNVSSRFGHGVIISNLPYGERLLTEKQLIPLYRDFGKMYRSLDEWCCYALTSYKDFERYFGKRAKRRRKLYNSQLECVLYQYLGKPPLNGI